MDKKISTEEAVNIIKEWGVDCDNFVAMNCKQSMVSGDPNDNSIELSEYFSECLKIVCSLGIKASSLPEPFTTLNNEDYFKED